MSFAAAVSEVTCRYSISFEDHQQHRGLCMINVFRLALAAVSALPRWRHLRSPRSYLARLKKVRDTKTFTIGHREASFPFAFYDDQKKPTGFAVELCTQDRRKRSRKSSRCRTSQIKYLPDQRADSDSAADQRHDRHRMRVDHQQPRRVSSRSTLPTAFYVTGGRLLASKASGDQGGREPDRQGRRASHPARPTSVCSTP